MIERRFRREFRSLEPIVGFVNEFLSARQIGSDEAHDVHLIVEELFTNMVKYHRESNEDIAIALDWQRPVLTVRLRDFDVNPYDVTHPPPNDLGKPIEERRSGGLGLHFVKQIADGLDYHWADRVSTITVTKRLDR